MRIVNQRCRFNGEPDRSFGPKQWS